jgi:hypothetical protein
MKDRDIEELLGDLIEASVLMSKLGKNELEVREMMQSAQDFLHDDTPVEVCLRGDGRSLIEWLKERIPNDELS